MLRQLIIGGDTQELCIVPDDFVSKGQRVRTMQRGQLYIVDGNNFLTVQENCCESRKMGGEDKNLFVFMPNYTF